MDARRTRVAGMALLAALTVLIAPVLVACGTVSGPGTTAIDPARTEPRDPSSPGRDRQDEPRDSPEPQPPTTRDRALAREFVAFATHPDAVTAAHVPWAPVVRLGLGEDLYAEVPRAALTDASTWEIDVDAYGRLGPLDALEPVRRQVLRDGASTVRVSVGPHPLCQDAPTPSPSRFEQDRRIALQPAPRTTDSCRDWFAVDLYVDRSGQVVGVTLEHWEP